MFVKGSERNEQSQQRTFHSPLLRLLFRPIWPNGFRGEESKKSANQKQESPVVAMFVNGSGQNEQSI
jgi:hypothetical protein